MATDRGGPDADRGVLLQDRLSRGLGRAARAMGGPCELYRPAGPRDPLAAACRQRVLHAAFAPPDPSFARPVGHGQAIWHGIFDAAYTRPGDYLVRRESRDGAGDGGIWFIAAQQRLLPPLCVRASRVLTVTRPAAPSAVGINAYGGVLADVAGTLLRGFPASVLEGGGGGSYQADLPTTAALGSWAVLLPQVPGFAPRAGDRVADDLGRAGVVASCELSDLGWRLSVKQAAA